jgi:hypothetical protein
VAHRRFLNGFERAHWGFGCVFAVGKRSVEGDIIFVGCWGVFVRRIRRRRKRRRRRRRRRRTRRRSVLVD